VARRAGQDAEHDSFAAPLAVPARGGGHAAAQAAADEVRAGACERHADRVRLLLADRILQPAADHRDHQFLPDRRERGRRPSGELRARLLEGVLQLAPEGDRVQQEILGEGLVRRLDARLQRSRLGPELGEAIGARAPGQLVQGAPQRVPRAGFAGARRSQRGLQGRELLPGAGEVVLEQLAVDRFLGRLRSALFVASHEES